MATECKSHRADPYSLLGIPRSASPGTVRRAYRQRALATHPDKGGTAESFRCVVRAFEILGSFGSRERYDYAAAPKANANGQASEQSQGQESETKRKKKVATQTTTRKMHSQGGNSLNKASAKRPRREREDFRLQLALEILRQASESVPKDLRRSMLSNLNEDLQKALLAYMQARLTHQQIVAVHLSSESSDMDCLQSLSSAASSSDSELTEEFGGHSLALSSWPNGQLHDEPSLASPSPEVCFPDQCQKTQQQTSESRHKSRTGIMGISAIGAEDQRVYRAKVAVSTIIMTSRTRRGLEDSISDHVVLVQVRESLRSALQMFGGSLDGSLSQVADIANALETAVERVFCEHEISNSAHCLCSFSSRISQPFISGTLDTNPTRSLSDCIHQRHKLVAARDLGWESFRKAWIEMTQSEEPRISGLRGKAKQNAEMVAACLDRAYEQYAPQRVRASEQLQRNLEKRQALQQARERRHLERVMRFYDRAVSRASHALARRNKLLKSEEAAASEEARQKQAAAERLRVKKEEWLAKERWQWHQRRDLTMSDILNGPPV